MKEQLLEVGNEVLVLPTKQNKLKLQWSGPYQITRKVTPVDYEVERPGRRQEKKVYHVNLLKKWHSSSKAFIAMAAEVEENDLEELDTVYLLETSSTQQKLTPEALSHLATSQAAQIEQLLQEFSDVAGARLGRTTVTEHTVEVGDTPPIRQHPYRERS